MKKWALVFLCLQVIFFCYGQKIISVGTGEYYVAFLTDSGSIYIPINVGNRYFTKKLNSPEFFVEVSAGTGSAVAIDKNKIAYNIGPGKTGGGLYATPVPGNDGKPFGEVDHVYGWNSSYLALKSGIPYTWGQDVLGLNKGKNIISPLNLSVPAGKKIKKLVPFSVDNSAVLALAFDGTVWKYAKGIKNPLKINIPGNAIDIAGIGMGVYVVQTSNDLFAWGFSGSYLGVADMSSRPVSVKKQWTSAGCEFPLKKMVGSLNTLHVLDANNHLFAAGDNVHGQIGNGKQWPDWSNYAPMPFNWSYKRGELLQRPVQIDGRFKDIFSAPNGVFYQYAIDEGGNLYSWGRGKGRVLGNGATLNWADEANYPEALNIPAPTLVDPINVKWKAAQSFLPDAPMAPFAHAGVNQYIAADHTKLSAAYTHQQKGTIVDYQWTIEGSGNATIESPHAVSTNVSNLAKGENLFRVKVTNQRGDTSSAVVSVFVR